jgi:hypothetical protein
MSLPGRLRDIDVVEFLNTDASAGNSPSSPEQEDSRAHPVEQCGHEADSLNFLKRRGCGIPDRSPLGLSSPQRVKPTGLNPNASSFKELRISQMCPAVDRDPSDSR